MSLSKSLAACINVHFMSCFCVLDTHKTYVRQTFGSWIINLYSHHIIFSVTYGNSIFKVIPCIEVTKNKSSATAFHNPCQIFNSHLYICFLTFWMEI